MIVVYFSGTPYPLCLPISYNGLALPARRSRAVLTGAKEVSAGGNFVVRRRATLAARTTPTFPVSLPPAGTLAETRGRYYCCYNAHTQGLLMVKETTIRAIGNSAGTTIPKPLLERYHLAEGDTVHLVETEEGILITPFDPDFQEAMEIYAEGAKRYRNAMRELAK